MTAADHLLHLARWQAAHVDAQRIAAGKLTQRDNAVREAVGAGISQAEVARVLGVSFQLVSRIVGRQ